MDKYSFSESLQAFLLYLEKGKSAVMRVYPDYMDFVLSVKDKTYKEVRDMLIREKKAKECDATGDNSSTTA